MKYIGNGAYCYANSTSMLLASIGEEVSPSLIEVLTGVSIGATLKKKSNLLYFNNQTLLPDLGLTKALDILGFSYQTKVFEKQEDFPLKELKKDLEISPAAIGPLDMGLLVYNPNHKDLKGVDHFVLAYKLDSKQIYVHDPAGFPHVSLSLNILKESWQAKNISYKRGYYRYTTLPKRIRNPSADKIYQTAVAFFKTIYLEGGKLTDKSKFEVGAEAIEEYANYVRRRGLNKKELGHFVYFAFPLGGKRASDYASFFKPHNKSLSEIKGRQAELFGECHTLTMERNWKLLSRSLLKLAGAESEFRKELFKVK